MTKYISIRSGATALPEQSVSHFSHDIIYQSGVLDLVNTHWAVSEHNPQNMNVDIAVGRGYFKKTIITYHGYSDAVETVVVTSNSSGNGRIDAVVAYVDLGASPNSDASNVLKFVVVVGIPAASPVAPTDGEILTSIGSGNPYIRLANITVANGASAITNTDITDTRVSAYIKVPGGIKDTDLLKPQVKASYQSIYTANVKGTVHLDCNSYNVFILTMTDDTIIVLDNPTEGQHIYIIFTNASDYGITWPTTTFWPDNVDPTPVGNYNGFILLFINVITNKYIGVQTFSNITVS